MLVIRRPVSGVASPEGGAQSGPKEAIIRARGGLMWPRARIARAIAYALLLQRRRRLPWGSRARTQCDATVGGGGRGRANARDDLAEAGLEKPDRGLIARDGGCALMGARTRGTRFRAVMRLR